MSSPRPLNAEVRRTEVAELPKIVPEGEESDSKEVFAFFGLAAYHGQVLEQELVIFAVMLHLSARTRVTQADVNALFDADGEASR